jgi:hypothetical protein
VSSAAATAEDRTMTTNKAQKRAIRTRMEKTGERYTAARQHLVSPNDNSPQKPETTLLPIDLETVGADLPQSNEAIRRGTGKDWYEWCAIFDAHNGTKLTHAQLARIAHDLSPEISGWWAQGVALGYERIRGMRVLNQDSTGAFRMSSSKTVPVPVEQLYNSFADETIRDRWIEPGTLNWRTGQPGRSARLDFLPAGTIISATFLAKGAAKASVAVEQTKLASADEVEPAKAYWKERLNRLAKLLTTDEPTS